MCFFGGNKSSGGGGGQAPAPGPRPTDPMREQQMRAAAGSDGPATMTGTTLGMTATSQDVMNQSKQIRQTTGGM